MTLIIQLKNSEDNGNNNNNNNNNSYNNSVLVCLNHEIFVFSFTKVLVSLDNNNNNNNNNNKVEVKENMEKKEDVFTNCCFNAKIPAQKKWLSNLHCGPMFTS